MLKRLAILAVLLAALPPMPGQAAESAAQGSGKPDNKAQGANGNPAPAMPVRDPAQPPKDTKGTGDPATDDKEHSVKLTSLPPVTIADKQKTFWDLVFDWGPWAFGLFLAIAGGVQLMLLKITWKTIQEQKTEMAIQTGILKDSVAASQKAADAAEISAKAAMGVAVPTLVISKFSFDNELRQNPAAFYQYPKVRLELKNYGQSPAFLRKYAINFSWNDDPWKKCIGYAFEDRVVDAGETYQFSVVDLDVLDIPPQTVIEDLIRGKKNLIFSGWVSYRDVFDSPLRKLTFCRELVEYDPDPAKMMVIDPSALELWTDNTDG
jgi:hypothetical protein